MNSKPTGDSQVTTTQPGGNKTIDTHNTTVQWDDVQIINRGNRTRTPVGLTARSASDAAAAAAAARAAIRPGDVLLVKGSNAVGLAAVVEALAGGPSAPADPERPPQPAAAGLGTGKG